MSLRFQKFSCAFLAFSLTANAREFKKMLVFQCSPFDELLENMVSSCVRGNFLVFSGKKVLVNSRKRFSPSVHRSFNRWKIARIPTFSLRFLAFPGTEYSGVFQSSTTVIVRSFPPRSSSEFSTVPRLAGYQCSGD